MKYTVTSSPIQELASSCLVLGVYENQALPPVAAQIDKLSNESLSGIMKEGDIRGKRGQSLLLHGVAGLKARRVLLIGCGKQGKLNGRGYAEVVDHASRALEKYGIGDALLTLPTLPVKGPDGAELGLTRKAQELAKIFARNQYSYHRTRSAPKRKSKLKKAVIHLEANGNSGKEKKDLRKGLTLGAAVAKGMATARELGNLPGNICTPTYLGKQALALAKTSELLSASVLSEAQMKRLGMGALLSVSAGSAQSAALIIMKYKGGGNSRPHVIVGKGITFDSGGISLKPGLAMDEMKFDMCGAASVFGTMTGLLELKPKINVIGVVASAENMPGGKATKPGDVVASMSGQTVEILNTDAEGRLVLCDALTYVERFKPQSVIDVATLTGACVIALGDQASGLMSNDDALAEKLHRCGLECRDPVWRLPLWEEYQEQLDSNFADMANIGGRKAGTITAGCFLARFAKKYPWAHIDIAGTAWLQGKKKGATGRPVPLLLEYLLQNQVHA